MKSAFSKSILTILLLTVSFQVKAGGNDVGNAGDLVSRLKALNGHTGKIVESYDKNNTGVCRLEASPYDTGGVRGVTISFQDTGMYFTPVAHIDAGTEIENNTTMTISTSSKRPGGDACGDFGGAIGYKKQIAMKGNKVAIRETFRCALEGFKKYDLSTICEF